MSEESTPRTGSAPRRVVLHIGAPKSGTTYLQKALWKNRESLRQAGFLLPGNGPRDMFLAAIEVRETYEMWGQRREDLEGTWARHCDQARGFEGTTIMSHELLAAASAEQVASARAGLEGLDVHLVFTARDLGRQVMSEWQERIKNGSTKSFASFQRGLQRQLRQGSFDSLFWRYQDIRGALSRWGHDLPPDNLHVVVAPRSGADPFTLWHLFGDAVGFDARSLDPTTSDKVTNQTLGVTQIAVLRKVNAVLDGRIKQPAYARVVKNHFGREVLGAHASPRPGCPPELVAELRQLSEDWIEDIRSRGWRVHGDLAELLPEPPGEAARPPDDVDAQATADTAVAAVADLLVEIADQRERLRRQQRLLSRHAAEAQPAAQHKGASRLRWRRHRRRG